MGAGSPVFANVEADAGTGNKLSFRSLTGGENISVSNNGNSITISTSGTITANLIGNVTGNLTGNVTGQVNSISNHSLSALGDVSDLTPLDGQILRYNVGAWSFTNLSTDMISEGTSNLFYSNYRARTSISVSGDLSYNEISGVISYTAPTYSTVATSGNYNDLTNKPFIFSGNYNDLTNKPFIFSGNYNDLTNKPNLAGTYSWSIGADDSTLRSINAGESLKIIGGTGISTESDSEGNITITGFSGNYNDLTNKPIFGLDFGSITTPSGFSFDMGSIV